MAEAFVWQLGGNIGTTILTPFSMGASLATGTGGSCELSLKLNIFFLVDALDSGGVIVVDRTVSSFVSDKFGV